MHAHFIIFYFFGLDPAARPGHWPKPVTRLAPSVFLPAGMRELLTHACYRNMIIKMKGEGNAAYLSLYLKMW